MVDPDVVRTLGRVEGKVDLMLDLMKEDRKRLASVEKKVWSALGTGVFAIGATVAQKFGIPIGTA
jgi:hypothetical protein